jgi:TRAP-type C4-dicarboxylate transport system permease small subunit
MPPTTTTTGIDRHEHAQRCGTGRARCKGYGVKRLGLLPAEPLPQRLSRLLAWVAGAMILFGCGLLISIDVVTRLVFNRGMVESFELSGYALAGAVGLGLAFSVTAKAHIRVDVAVVRLPAGLRRAADLIAALALALVAVALAWFAWGTLSTSWRLGARSVSLMQTPLAIPQGLWWIGLAWFACVAALLPLQASLRWLAGDRAGFDAMIGSTTVDDEIAHETEADPRP